MMSRRQWGKCISGGGEGSCCSCMSPSVSGSWYNCGGVGAEDDDDVVVVVDRMMSEACSARSIAEFSVPFWMGCLAGVRMMAMVLWRESNARTMLALNTLDNTVGRNSEQVIPK